MTNETPVLDDAGTTLGWVYPEQAPDHVHWAYRTAEGYETFLRWPTRELATEALRGQQ